MKASASSDRGSYSVEGALSLTVFTACLMALISILTVIKTEAEIGDALRETAMELSQYSYVWGRTEYLKDYAEEKLPKLAELMGDPEGTSDLSLTGPAVAKLLTKQYFPQDNADEWLKKQGNLMALWEKQAYELMHKQGYLVFQAHPFRPYILRCNPDYIDGIEVYNGKCDALTNFKALQWAIETGKLVSSGSDFHTPKHLARGGIITKEPIKNNNDLVRILKSRDYKLIKTN